MLAPHDSPGITTEAERIEAWRLHELLNAGYPVALAEQLAQRWEGEDAIDLHRAIELVTGGCSPQTAAEILL